MENSVVGYILIAVLIVFALLLMFCLLRAVLGPLTADRMVAVNMAGTIVIVMIAILTVLLDESFLADICLVYAMMSFLAVIVLVKVYIGTYSQDKTSENSMEQENKTAQ